jgi:hypothetical protein
METFATIFAGEQMIFITLIKIGEIHLIGLAKISILCFVKQQITPRKQIISNNLIFDRFYRMFQLILRNNPLRFKVISTVIINYYEPFYLYPANHYINLLNISCLPWL